MGKLDKNIWFSQREEIIKEFHKYYAMLSATQNFNVDRLHLFLAWLINRNLINEENVNKQFPISRESSQFEKNNQN